jgi:hypothetical protein
MSRFFPPGRNRRDDRCPAEPPGQLPSRRARRFLIRRGRTGPAALARDQMRPWSGTGDPETTQGGSWIRDLQTGQGPASWPKDDHRVLEKQLQEAPVTGSSRGNAASPAVSDCVGGDSAASTAPAAAATADPRGAGWGAPTDPGRSSPTGRMSTRSSLTPGLVGCLAPPASPPHSRNHRYRRGICGLPAWTRIRRSRSHDWPPICSTPERAPTCCWAW